MGGRAAAYQERKGRDRFIPDQVEAIACLLQTVCKKWKYRAFYFELTLTLLAVKSA